MLEEKRKRTWPKMSGLWLQIHWLKGGWSRGVFPSTNLLEYFTQWKAGTITVYTTLGPDRTERVKLEVVISEVEYIVVIGVVGAREIHKQNRRMNEASKSVRATTVRN
jgi:hypothetical protein